MNRSCSRRAALVSGAQGHRVLVSPVAQCHRALRLGRCVLAWLISLSSFLSCASGASLHWVSPPDAPESSTVQLGELTASELSELRRAHRTLDQWQQLLAVQVEQDDLAAQIGLPAMAGEYRVGPKSLTFTPGYPLVAGVRYRAVFYPDALWHARPQGTPALTQVFSLPARATNATTVVTQIYPTTPLVPENLLKFYIHFSAPMSRGHIYDHIRLLNDTGQVVELPFLEIDEELWDPDLKRLTLFIDPGRIKRGVQPLEEVGPSLVNGRRYTLKVDPGWRDGRDRPLRAGFEKHFAVGPPDRTPPDPAQWRLDTPRASSSEPLKVTFSDPMDHALALRMIHVTRGADQSEHRVEGTIALGEEERQWTLRPAEPWHRGPHQLVVRSTIEDLAGNNIGKPFEVDVLEGVQRHLSNTWVRVKFDVR
jgi:hypothetical protein